MQTIAIGESELQTVTMTYSESLLDAWKNGDYSMLKSSNASEFIKKILITKAKSRPGERFFGEAHIASRLEMADGWYNSYKWLTSRKWLTGDGMEPKFEKPFYKALMRHVGPDVLANLQEKTLSFYHDHKNEFMEGIKYKKPVAPDLWIIDKEGRFRFIESKLPRDTIKPHQLAGLALIAKYLKAQVPVSVSIIDLHPEGIDLKAAFSRLYNLA